MKNQYSFSVNKCIFRYTNLVVEIPSFLTLFQNEHTLYISNTNLIKNSDHASIY